MSFFKRKGESRPHIFCAAHIDGLRMGIDDVLDNGQAEARSAGIACAALIHSVKTLKDPRNIAFRNAHSVIADLYQNIFVQIEKSDLHLSPILVSVFHRIVE